MDKFVEELIRELSLVLDDTYSLVRMDSQKTNGVLLDGIRFDRKGEKVSPIVHMENYYDAYTDGRMTMKMIVKSIVKLISEKCDVEDIVEKMQQYNLIQYELVFSLINYELNREILMERPHKRFLDLAAVAMIRVETSNGIDGVVYVTNNMLKSWNIDEDTLFEQCMSNTLHREKHEVCSMRDIIANMYKGIIDEEFLQMLLENILEDMYVFTNETRNMGANILLNHTLLHEFAMQNESNLIIYPSSLHEVIIVFEKNFSAGRLDSDMVKQINENKVNREEWLSNSVYMYDREQEKLVIYQQGEPLCNNVEAERMAC